jgi:cytosine/adenosine deaminase-related metal-dependent hydrolase
VLGRATDLGQIKPGYCADLAMFRLDTVAMAGAAVHDPVGALLLCASAQADYTVVHGQVVVREGQVTRLDLPRVIEQHNQYALKLAQMARV